MLGEEGVVPSEGVSSGTSDGGRAPLSFLNAQWVNARVINVTAKVNSLLDRLIDQGLLGSGYPPFETPVTDAMLQKMTPEQFRALYDTLTTLEQKSALLARMQALKLPLRELLPKVNPVNPVNPVTSAGPVAGLAPSPVESTSGSSSSNSLTAPT